jgi:hypothetical protein
MTLAHRHREYVRCRESTRCAGPCRPRLRFSSVVNGRISFFLLKTLLQKVCTEKPAFIPRCHPPAGW